jgi:Fe-Mn family superoxide dismutase
MMQTKTTAFNLPPLPYKLTALEPHLSAMTLSYHYDKHHQGYLIKLNELCSGTEFAELSLEEVIRKTSGNQKHDAVFNNAAQVWNHTFYWNSLSPGGGKKPAGGLGETIDRCFGSYENFLSEFAKAGIAQFGSGWVWLVKKGTDLKIMSTPNAENPISNKQGTALLALDVWEHAYYLDFQNRRNEYLAVLLSKIINWNFAAENFSKA